MSAYLILPAVDAARALNDSALPDAPVVVEPERSRPVARTAAALLERAALAQLRLARRVRPAQPVRHPATAC